MATMDPATRANVKRAVMTLVPGITPPVIDFAINNVWLASISASSARSLKENNVGLSRAHGAAAIGPKSDPGGSFTLRKMDSGEWGELSLADPLQRRYKTPDFKDPSKLEFKMDGISE